LATLLKITGVPRYGEPLRNQTQPENHEATGIVVVGIVEVAPVVEVGVVVVGVEVKRVIRRLPLNRFIAVSRPSHRNISFTAFGAYMLIIPVFNPPTLRA